MMVEGRIAEGMSVHTCLPPRVVASREMFQSVYAHVQSTGHVEVWELPLKWNSDGVDGTDLFTRATLDKYRGMKSVMNVDPAGPKRLIGEALCIADKSGPDELQDIGENDDDNSDEDFSLEAALALVMEEADYSLADEAMVVDKEMEVAIDAMQQHSGSSLEQVVDELSIVAASPVDLAVEAALQASLGPGAAEGCMPAAGSMHTGKEQAASIVKGWVTQVLESKAVLEERKHAILTKPLGHLDHTYLMEVPDAKTEFVTWAPRHPHGRPVLLDDANRQVAVVPALPKHSKKDYSSCRVVHPAIGSANRRARGEGRSSVPPNILRLKRVWDACLSCSQSPAGPLVSPLPCNYCHSASLVCGTDVVTMCVLCLGAWHRNCSDELASTSLAKQRTGELGDPPALAELFKFPCRALCGLCASWLDGCRMDRMDMD